MKDKTHTTTLATLALLDVEGSGLLGRLGPLLAHLSSGHTQSRAGLESINIQGSRLCEGGRRDSQDVLQM